ncbi:MAG: EpsG family protein [Tannerellaceae bacterium]
MITTPQYTSLYYGIIVFFFVILNMCEAYKVTDFISRKRAEIMVAAFGIFNSFYWGLRPWNIGTDTGNYLRSFRVMERFTSFSQMIDNVDGDYFFRTLMFLFSRFGAYSMFLLSVSALTSMALLYYTRLMSDKGRMFSPILFMLYIVSVFSFPSMSCNIIRNGLAVSFLLVFSWYLLQGRWVQAACWAVLALLGHHTTAIPILFMVLIRGFEAVKLKWFYYLYGAVVVLSALNFGVHRIGALTELGIDKVNDYFLSDGFDYRVGFRADFVLFNTFFAGLFYAINSKTVVYEFYLKYYLLASCLFFFWFHIPFSDRIGLYSWIAIPIVAFLGINERFPVKRQMYSLLMFLMIFIINYALASR